jgi:hypothetical protein
MSSFIIIKNAQRNAKRRREEKERMENEREAHEKKMIKDGYVKRHIITNESFRYEHMYVSPKKKIQGKILMILAALTIPLIVMSFMMIPEIGILFYSSIALFFIYFFVGYGRYQNAEFFWTSSKEPKYRKELYWESVKDVAKYGFEWVKKSE